MSPYDFQPQLYHNKTTLYYYKIVNIKTGRTLYKIGITVFCCQHRIDNTEFGKGWETEILWEIKMNDDLAYETEQFLKKKYARHCSSCEAQLMMNEGYTETFDYDITLYEEAAERIAYMATLQKVD